MINEKEVLRREEIDFRGVVNRFKRGWPIVLLAVGGMLFIGMIFELTYPPQYIAKTTILIEKPKGVNDPAAIVSMNRDFAKTEDYFYNNSKVELRSYPLLRKSLESLGAISYYSVGLFKKEIYENIPFRVELDSSYMSFAKHETPYGATFELEFNNFNEYSLAVDGKYAVTSAEYEVEGNFRFGEWIQFDKTRFRVLAIDTIQNPNIKLLGEIFDMKFGFAIKDFDALTLDLMGSITIEPEDLEATVFGVEVSGGAPERQLAFLTSLGNFYIADHIANKTRALTLAIDFLQNEIAEIESQLMVSGSAIEQFKTERSITSLNREGTLLMEQMVTLENNKVNHLVKQKYYGYLESFLKENNDYESLISPQAFGVKDQLIIHLTEELVKMQQEMNSIMSMGAVDNPVVKQLQQKIETNRTTIMRSMAGLKQSNQIMIDDLDARITTMRNEASEIPRAQRELMELERFFRINEKLYVNLMEKKADAEITLVSTSPDFKVVEPPYLTSTDPFLPNLPITFIVAVILGLFISFMILLFKWLFSSTVDSAEDVRKHLHSATIAGEIFNTNITKPSNLLDYPDSTLSQKLYQIHYSLLRRSPQAVTIGVGSPEPNNGKSFFAHMYAVRLSMAGYKTLLVDANFKNPSAKKAFKLGQKENLYEVLNNDISTREALLPSGIKNLDVADFGSGNNMSDKQVLAAGDLIKELGQAYDRVVIDTSPYNKLSSSLHLLNHTDQFLILIRRKAMKIKTLSEIQDSILEGLLKDPLVILTDTFDSEVSLNVLERRSNYENNKSWGIAGRVKRVFKRI